MKSAPARLKLLRLPYLFAFLLCICRAVPLASAQEPSRKPVAEELLVVRPAPQPLDDFEADKDPQDGKPDGWYNDRDAVLASPGHTGQHCLRLENDKPGRPARISRGFGVDGAKFGALRFAAWVKVKGILPGEHQGEDPSILIDFLSRKLLTTNRVSLGPFNDATVGEDRWFYVSKILPIHPETVDGIMTVGLMGATGRFEIDGMEMQLLPRQVLLVDNLVPNPEFEFGDHKPDSWSIEGTAHRVSEGYRSPTAAELGRGMGRLLTGLGRRVDDIQALKVSLMARGVALRTGGGGGAVASLYFVDERGRAIANRASQAFLRFGGSFAWTFREATLEVPAGAVGAVLQLEKLDSTGTLTIDQISVTDDAGNLLTRWAPRAVPLDDKADTWPEFRSFDSVEKGSALDTTAWGLDSPKGRIAVKDGHFVDGSGKPARFWGVSLLPTAGFPEQAKAAAIADRLQKLGVNVVRFGDLDLAYGPGRSLIDDVRDDTAGIDAVAWARMTNLQKELADRGVYYSLEMHAHRRFREGDGLPDARRMTPGGGPAAIFDPELTNRADELSKLILSQPVNAEGNTLAQDSHLAWVTEMGETSLIDLAAGAATVTDRQSAMLKDMQRLKKASSPKQFQIDLEKERTGKWAELLKEVGLKAPIAGVGHWRREQEWAATLSAPGLSVVEDRYYWPYAPWSQPAYRSSVFDSARSLASVAVSKRQKNMAYVMAQWCTQSQGAWALPTEAADILMGAWAARQADFDALVRRGLALHPESWGESATGTGGDRNIFLMPESLSGMPQMIALMPHVASILRRDREPGANVAETKPAARGKTKGLAPQTTALPGWNPEEGVLRVATPHTVGLAGSLKETAEAQKKFDDISLEFEGNFGVIVASSATSAPIGKSDRILVTLLGRAVPTGLRYTDNFQKEVADPGRPPLRVEPVKGRFTWYGTGSLKVYAIDNSGKRGVEVPVTRENDAQRVEMDASTGGPHWEVMIIK